MTAAGSRMSCRHPHLTAFSFGPAVQCPFPTVTAAFYNQAAWTCPHAIAVRDLSGPVARELTYRELAGHAQALALTLRSLGVQRDQRIPLIVKRGVEMVVGIWAILSCGAQYVPLDGGVVPDSTIRLVMEQAEAPVVVCLRSTEHRVRSLCPAATAVLVDQGMAATASGHGSSTLQLLSAEHSPWVDLATPDSGCYVIYTSGTTGKPKGVDVMHKNVANLVCTSPGNLGVRPGMCVGQVLNISFDMAAWEIFACLCNGGTLVVRGSHWEPTIQELHVLICTPTVLSNYSPSLYPNIKTVATAGEATSQDLADLWASKATYWNCCGPTETTIVNTMSRHVCGDAISIGRPTPNNSVYILDDEKKPVAEGVAGVMWAGGLGVSRGYVALEAKTKESYIPDPFMADGSVMYCTGDLGRWRPDGSIEILGRCDDQVKVKGFRVELDGVSNSMASAPGVTRATTLLVDGQLHGFVVPANQDAQAVLEHVQKSQPYYAVPSRIHQLHEFPMTANGKIDKKILRDMIAAPPQPAVASKDEDEDTPKGTEKSSSPSQSPSEGSGSPNSDCGTLVEQRSIRSVSSTSTLGTAVAVPIGPDISQDVPEKQWPQPFRGLRHRVLIIYRLLFGIIGLANIGAVVALVLVKPGPEWMATLTGANLLAAVLVRQDAVINVMYTIFCSMPRTAPLWIRRRCAKIYHLGGLHSGAAFCATAWLLASTVRATVWYAQGLTSGNSLATLVVSWLLSTLCCSIVTFAIPSFRKTHHNAFERLHRFLGWTAVALFWLRSILSIYDATPPGADIGLALIRSPSFWMLGLATCSIASSWLFLRRVPVDAVPLSDHAIQLNFKYTVPVNGSFTRISTRPLLEWHSFATIPVPEPCGITTERGYSLIVSNAGDWTKNCIRNPPTKLWIRGLPTCGVMRITTLFNRVVIIATGSGIGPMLGHITRPSCPTQLIWSAPTPEKTFGKSIMDTIRQSLPNAIIHDTKEKGRPDLVKMGYNTAKSFGAEAVVIIANEKITKKVVYGLETRGLAAFGAIWDS